MATLPAARTVAEASGTRIRSRDLLVRRHGEEGLHLLRPFWDGLLERSRADSMFLSWEWQESWWRHHGGSDGRDLQILSFHSPRERLVGIAPLYGQRLRWNGIPLRTLRFLGDGSGDGDDLDVIAAPGAERAVCVALFRALRDSGDWDVVDLCPVPAESATVRALARMAHSGDWYCRPRELACSHTPLPREWDEFLGTLKSRLRSRVRSLLRRHVDSEDSRIERVEGTENLERCLEILFDLHTRRWEEIGEPGAFATAARRRFFRDFALRALQRGWLRLYILHHEGAPLAAQIGYVYRGTFLAIQEGFDPDRGQLSPGVALRAAVLRECIRDGLEAYDNLLGTSSAKMRWGAEPRPVHGLTLARRGSAGSSALRLIDAGRDARDVLRSWMDREQ